MDVLHFVMRYAWLLFIAGGIGNALVIRHKTEANVALNPQLAQGYQRLLRRYIVIGNIPWVAMGLIFMTSGVQTIFEFLQPNEGNPYVVTWFALVIALWAYEIYWIFFNGGAEALVNHPGAYQLSFSRPWQVKLLWAACTSGGVAGMVIMWNSVIQFR